MIAGCSDLSTGEQTAFLWRPGSGFEQAGLGPGFGRGDSCALEANKFDVVAGRFEDGGLDRAFVAYGPTTYDLSGADFRGTSFVDPAAGWVFEEATAINDNGEVVGYGRLGGETRAFRLTPSVIPAVISLDVSSAQSDSVVHATITLSRPVPAGSSNLVVYVSSSDVYVVDLQTAPTVEVEPGRTSARFDFTVLPIVTATNVDIFAFIGGVVAQATLRALPQEFCLNGIDDDEDGRTDCADSECEGVQCASCKFCSAGECRMVELDCNNGTDDDCDDLSDCGDPDCEHKDCAECSFCFGDECLQKEPICGDEQDNDCDGQMDCADGDCSGEACGVDLVCTDMVCG